MIIYSTRTKRLPLNLHFITDNSTAFKMFRYDENLMSRCGDLRNQEQITSDVFYTYNTLVKFNNTLDSNIKEAFIIVDKYLNEHQKINNSLDNKCRTYYDKIIVWNNRYIGNPSDEVIKGIRDEVQGIMKFLCKQEIVAESSCNLKKNYY